MASELAAALAAFQAEIPRIEKTQAALLEGESKTTGRKFVIGYKYADLANVTAIVLPLLGKHGLSFTACPKLTEHGFVLHYRLRHVSGEGDEGEWPLPDPIRTKPQAVASAITYARRYALYAATGVAPDDEDDDAKAAQEEHGRADGLPVNKDGSLSRSRTTDAEKDAAGNMTAAQWAEHTSLQNGADGKLPPAEAAKVERVTITPPDDPFAGIPGAGDATPPEDRHGTATTEQIRDVNIRLSNHGLTRKAERLAYLREQIGHEVFSSADLSFSEAAKILRELPSKPKAAADA